MGVSGQFELREAAALGFGAYDQTYMQGQGVATSITVLNNPMFQFTQKLPEGAAGGGRPYQLIGSMLVVDQGNSGASLPVPADLVHYALALNSPNVTPGAVAAKLRIATSNPEPLMVFLGREAQLLQLIVGYRGWLATPLSLGPSIMLETLTGTLEQLERLIKWAGTGHAPASLIADAIDLLTGAGDAGVSAAADAGGGYY